MMTMRRFNLKTALIYLSGSLWVAATPSAALADPTVQIMQECLSGEFSGITAITEADTTRAEAAPIFYSLDDVMAQGLALTNSKPAAEWSIEEIIIAYYAEQSEQLRTGALPGQLLRSEFGLMYRWVDTYGFTLCMMALPATTSPLTPSALPVVGQDTIFWRAAPMGENTEFTSQIILISDRPE
jgi:hypothetical protein